MKKIIQVTPLPGYQLGLTFDDGVQGTVDLAYLAGKGVFACLCDRKTFEDVRIGSSGELLWGEEADLCPDALYLKVTGKRLEDIMSPIPAEPIHA